MIYNVLNWYWAVGNDESQVYSSQAVGYVPVANADYIGWTNLVNLPTKIDSVDSLYGVLADQWLPQIFTQGVTVTSTGSPDLNGWYAYDPQAQRAISAIMTGINAGQGLPGGGSQFSYGGHTFNETQFIAFAIGMQNYAYSCTQTLQQIVTMYSGAAFPLPEITIA
jgi:hypothetical protein